MRNVQRVIRQVNRRLFASFARVDDDAVARPVENPREHHGRGKLESSEHNYQRQRPVGKAQRRKQDLAELQDQPGGEHIGNGRATHFAFAQLAEEGCRATVRRPLARSTAAACR